MHAGDHNAELAQALLGVSYDQLTPVQRSVIDLIATEQPSGLNPKLTGDDRNDPQCDKGRGLTWTLHGLWPQYDSGYPSDCRSVASDPNRSDSTQMADIMGGAGLAFYEWKKHGRCSGLSAKSYYATMRKAYKTVGIPPIIAKISKDLSVPASVIEDAFSESNPQIARDQMTVTCTQGMIQELRICLTKDLEPRRCGADTIKDCTLKDAGLQAVR
ncbi:MAG: ribonuclease T [Rhodobacterales bacterium 17-64-5]|nr:MAG: ribonuclease T [Rhodobacterales bacterium 17-64-5]